MNDSCLSPDSERVGERYYGIGGLVAAILLVCFVLKFRSEA
jgi:hypothetical protein